MNRQKINRKEGNTPKNYFKFEPMEEKLSRLMKQISIYIAGVRKADLELVPELQFWYHRAKELIYIVKVQ